MREQGLYVHIHASIVCHVHVLSLQRDELRGKYSICVGICRIALGKVLVYFTGTYLPKKSTERGKKAKVKKV